MPRLIISFLLILILFTPQAFAIVDPQLAPNNKVGINTLSPEGEIDEAHQLVNTNGDWGYIVVTIKKTERDIERWQTFLNKLNDKHLIPIIRLATEFDKEGFWQKPEEKDAQEWADFLGKLYFPTKNRYIQVYNEVNRSTEWGGEVDPDSYAKELNKTIDTLKSKNEDFYILNSPLDLALANSKDSIEAAQFFLKMELAIPGIFKKLDGWASHSYPNPDFSASPYKLGRTGINGYSWELSEVAKYTVGKEFPVFITETGWRRETEDQEGLTEDQIADYYKEAFANIWSDRRVVAVAPFVLGYPEPLFNKFSFKTNATDKSYYRYFDTIKDLPKITGSPVRENEISSLNLYRPTYLIKNTENFISVSFKNNGNFIWNTKTNLKIQIHGQNISDYTIFWNKDEIYPGQEALAIIKVKTHVQGILPVGIQIFYEDKIIEQRGLAFRSETPFSLFVLRIKSLFS